MAIKIGSPSAPKARLRLPRKSAPLRGFWAPGGGQHCPPRCPPQPGPILREQGAIPGASDDRMVPLGRPLDIREVARMIGCSPWTVRQTLVPRGLPHFRFRANGRLVFYRDQVIRWIEKSQGGNQ